MCFGQVVIVDWEAYCSPWTVYFTKLWNSPQFADVVIHCGKDFLKCHSIIVSAHSERFHSAFLDSLNVRIEGIELRELKTILGFMYTGRVIIQRNQLGPLFEAAKALGVTKLIELIETKRFTTLEEFLSAQEKDNHKNNNGDKSAAVSKCQQTTTPTVAAELPQVQHNQRPSIPAPLPRAKILLTSSSPIPVNTPLTFQTPSNPALATTLARLSKMGVVIQIERKVLTGDEVPPTPDNSIFQRPDPSVTEGVGQPTPVTSTSAVSEPEPNTSSEELQEQFSPLEEQEMTDNSIPLVIPDDTESETVDAGCPTDVVSDNKVNVPHGVTVTGTALASVSAAEDDGARFSEYRSSDKTLPNKGRLKALNFLNPGKLSLGHSRRSGISDIKDWLTRNSVTRTKDKLGAQNRSKSEQFRRYKKAQKLIEQGTPVKAAAMQVGVIRTSLIGYLKRDRAKKAKESDSGKGENN